MKHAATASIALSLASPVCAEERPSVAPENMQAIAPGPADHTDRVLFGDVWERAELSPRDRNLVAITALAADGDTDQLVPEIQRAMANGLTRGDIGKAFTHLAFYAGWPKAAAAIDAAGKVASAAPAAAFGGIGNLKVSPAGSTPTPAPAADFTGSVVQTSRFSRTGGSRLGGATVSFAAGARTNWHTHPLGQLLVVIAGQGLVQTAGEPVRSVVGLSILVAVAVVGAASLTGPALTAYRVQMAFDAATVMAVLALFVVLFTIVNRKENA